MATTISIATGPLTASRTFQNDTRAQAALLRFYTAYNIGPPEATNQQKLNAVVDWFVDQVVNVSVESHVDQERATLEQAGQTLYDFKNGA